jgi:hypothetical protein
MHKLRRKEEVKPTAAPPRQAILLEEIRDLLKKPGARVRSAPPDRFHGKVLLSTEA